MKKGERERVGRGVAVGERGFGGGETNLF